VLTGWRRDYIINELTTRNIKFRYFEKIDTVSSNELYNCLDLYIVASRVEGGPMSILEAGITRTPIISTDVGIASKILSDESIFNMNNYKNAKPNVEYAYSNSKKFTQENINSQYLQMIDSVHEN
jgi:glycosyltransferase involved in cell wall biosynthesis